MTEYKITSVTHDPSYFKTLLANFQNGQLEPNQDEKLQCLAYRNAKSNETIIAAATEKMTYAGTDKTDEDLCYTLLTIRNKRTNKVRIVPVTNISLNAVVSKINTSLDSSLNVTEGTIGNLNRQFGSKRAKIKTEQYERMKMNVSNVQKELEETVADMKIKAEDLIIPTDDNDKFYRPPMNRNASTVEQVYDINTIITPQELSTLEELATAVLENDIEKEKYCVFVAEYIEEVKKSKSKNKLFKIELLLYIDAIVKFFKIQVKAIGRKVPSLEPYPDTISSKIYQEFTVLSNNNRSRPISMKDKSSCYCIVIALLALDYQFNLEPLSKSINVGVKKLTDICKVLGVQINYTKSKNDVILKLPLPPAPSIFSKKKK